MFQAKVVEKIKTHIFCSINLFWKSCRLCGDIEKYSRMRDSPQWQYGAFTLHAG